MDEMQHLLKLLPLSSVVPRRIDNYSTLSQHCIQTRCHIMILYTKASLFLQFFNLRRTSVHQMMSWDDGIPFLDLPRRDAS